MNVSTLPIGRPFREDGIQFQLVQRVHSAIYPTRHTVVEFAAEPTAAGRRASAYRATRRELGDDWDRDLTWSESLVPAMLAAGLTEAEAETTLREAHAIRMAGYR